MRFKQSEFRKMGFKLFKDGLNRTFLLFFRNYIMSGRIDKEIIHIFSSLSGLLVHLGNPVNLISEKLNPDNIVKVPWDNINGIPFYPEAPRHKLKVVPLELDFNKLLQDFLSLDPISNL